MSQKDWTPDEVTRMLTNPFYTGVKVHPALAVQRPVCRDKFLRAASRPYIKRAGPEGFLRDFFWVLQFPDEWTRQVILVHPRFTEDHPAILTVERFIEAGAIQIRDLGIETYCNCLLDNLEAAK